VNVQEFLEHIGAGPPAPVYLFCPWKGPRARTSSFEPLLAQRALERATSLFVDPSMKDLCYAAYFADETDAAEVADMARTVPFLTERRVVVVYRAERYASEPAGAALLRYLEAPSESTLLMLVTDQLDRRWKLYKACDKAGGIVDCPELKEHEVLLWARTEIESRGKDIDGTALRELVDRTGTHLSEVNNAIHLVCGFVGERDRITRDDVAAACTDVDEEEVWALTDAIARSDTGTAVRVLREIVDPNKNEFQILGSINWLLKSAYAVAAGGPTRNKLSTFVARKVTPLADKLGREKFRDAFALCLDTDLMLRSTGVDRSLALELLVIKLAAPRTAKRA